LQYDSGIVSGDECDHDADGEREVVERPDTKNTADIELLDGDCTGSSRSRSNNSQIRKALKVKKRLKPNPQAIWKAPRNGASFPREWTMRGSSP